MNKLEYETKLYKGNLSFLLVFIIPFGSILLCIYIGRLLDIPPIIAFPIVIFLFISPLIFKKKIKAIFTSKVVIEMDDKYFSISFLDSIGEVTKKQLYPWNIIRSYNFAFGENTPTLTALTLHFKKGMPKTFNFIDKDFNDTKSYNQMFESECLINLFYNQVKQYNIEKAEGDKIQLLSGFLASKTGITIIYMITILIIIAIILHLTIDPKSSFATLLISIGLVAGFFSKRKSSLELYKKIKELDK